MAAVESSNSYTWLAVILSVLTFIYWQGLSRYNSILGGSPLRGPKVWPWIGNLLDIFKYGGIHKMFLNYFRKYGRVHTMCFGRTPVIVVSDPEIVKQILVKDFYKFPNRPTFIKPNPPLDSGLFQAENGKWKRIRTTVAPTFTASKLKEIVPIIDDASQKLMAKMEKFAETGESVDVNHLFSLFALEVIMKAAFGFDSDVQMNPDPEFVEKANNVFKTPVIIRVFSLFPFWTYFSRYFSILQNVEYFISIAKEMLQKRAKKGPTAKKDLVELMMEAQENIVDGVSKLNDDEIMAQSITFLVAGFETTGSTLTSTAYLLATNPAVQDKLIEEIDKAEVEMARNNSSLYDHVQKLGYLDQVISEVLRLCSPAFNLVRGCEEEVVYKGIRFPKGVEVNIPSYVLHRDPEVWKNPLQFNPENFSPEAKEKRNPYSFIPFGTGPRHCLGMRFALLEIKVALLKILQRFKFECAPETVATLEHRAVILMAPKDLIYLKIKAR